MLQLLDRRRDRRSWPTVEEVQDLVEKALIERGHARTAKAYIVYRYEHALKRAGRESLTYSSENIPYRKLWEALSWASDHDCVTLEQLSRLIAGGGLGALVEDGGCLLRKRAGRGGGEDRRPPRRAARRHHRRTLLVGQIDDDTQDPREARGGGNPDGPPDRGQLLLRPATSTRRSGTTTAISRRRRRWTSP